MACSCCCCCSARPWAFFPNASTKIRATSSGARTLSRCGAMLVQWRPKPASAAATGHRRRWQGTSTRFSVSSIESACMPRKREVLRADRHSEDRERSLRCTRYRSINVKTCNIWQLSINRYDLLKALQHPKSLGSQRLTSIVHGQAAPPGRHQHRVAVRLSYQQLQY
jgi:hypothetical protein